jgi:UPF0716 protein FxsA
MRLLLSAFIVVPLVELYLLLWVSRWVGFWPTIALTLITGAVGASLARREGLRVLREWQRTLSSLESPTTGLLQGGLILVGGAFLLTPGVLTDLAGVLLLLPATRQPIATALRRRIDRYIATRTVVLHDTGSRGTTRGGPPVIDTTGHERG